MVYRRRRGPSRRRYRKRRAGYRRRTPFKKARRVRSRRARKTRKVLHVKLRTGEGAWDTVVKAANQPICANRGLSFALQDTVQYHKYSELFEEYRINKVVVHVMWQRQVQMGLPLFPATEAGVNVQGTDVVPRFGWAIDHDDAAAPTDYSNLAARDGFHEVWLTAGKKVDIPITPSILSMVYSSLVSTAYGPKYKTWIDTANDGVPHFGLKFGVQANWGHNVPLDPGEAPDLGRLMIEATYYVSFRGIKDTTEA